MKTQLNISNKTCKTLAFILSFLLIFEQSGFAQVAGELGIPGQIAALQEYIVPDAFRPLHLRSLQYDTLNNNFKLLLDKGDQYKDLSQKGTDPKRELQDITKQLLTYFSVGLTLPNDAFWVNLRPDGEANIIDSDLAKTDVGRVLLEADLQLKKDTARFTSPETPQGKAYWDKLYKKAENLFGTQNITIPTLTRVWILPHEIIISENKTSAYIYKATLRVLLEKDYLKDSSSYQFDDPKQKELNEYSSQLFRELIIPKLTKEVNASKRYANLRQVYYSLIMAQWFKARFKGLSPKGTLPDLIDTRNLTSLTSKEPWSTTTYFKAYQKSVNEGEYNIQQNQDAPFTSYHQTTKSYFSGGVITNCDIPALGRATFTKFDPATNTGTSVTSIPAANTAVNPGRGVGVEVDALGEVNITQAQEAEAQAAPKEKQPTAAIEQAKAKLTEVFIQAGIEGSTVKDIVKRTFEKENSVELAERLISTDAPKYFGELSRGAKEAGVDKHGIDVILIYAYSSLDYKADPAETAKELLEIIKALKETDPSDIASLIAAIYYLQNQAEAPKILLRLADAFKQAGVDKAYIGKMLLNITFVARGGNISEIAQEVIVKDMPKYLAELGKAFKEAGVEPSYIRDILSFFIYYLSDPEKNPVEIVERLIATGAPRHFAALSKALQQAQVESSKIIPFLENISSLPDAAEIAQNLSVFIEALTQAKTQAKTTLSIIEAIVSRKDSAAFAKELSVLAQAFIKEEAGVELSYLMTDAFKFFFDEATIDSVRGLVNTGAPQAFKKIAGTFKQRGILEESPEGKQALLLALLQGDITGMAEGISAFAQALSGEGMSPAYVNVVIGQIYSRAQENVQPLIASGAQHHFKEFIDMLKQLEINDENITAIIQGIAYERQAAEIVKSITDPQLPGTCKNLIDALTQAKVNNYTFGALNVTILPRVFSNPDGVEIANELSAFAKGSPDLIEAIFKGMGTSEDSDKFIRLVTDAGAPPQFKNAAEGLIHAGIDPAQIKDFLARLCLNNRGHRDDLIRFLSDENKIMVQEKFSLARILTDDFTPEVFNTINKYADEQVNHKNKLAFYRGIKGILSGEAMVKEDTAKDWELLLNDYILRFGYLNNRNLILVHRALSNNDSLEGSILGEYKLRNMGVESSGEEGIKKLADAVNTVRSKIVDEGNIDETLLDSPLMEAFIGLITGFSSAAWGHGSSRGIDLKEFVAEFNLLQREGLIPPLPEAYKGRRTFQVHKQGKAEFSEGVQNAYNHYQSLIREAVVLSGLPAQERLKRIREEVQKIVGAKIAKLQTGLARGNPFIKQQAEELDKIGRDLEASQDLLNSAIILAQYYKENIFRDPIALALATQVFNKYPKLKDEIVPALEQGLSPLSLSKIITLKNVFLKEHILNEVDKKIKRAMLATIDVDVFEKEMSKIKSLEETTEVAAFATKGILGEMAGDIGDACYTAVENIMQIPHLVSIILTSGEGLEKQLIGSMLILENTVNGDPVLILRAINPSEEFITSYNPEDFLKGIIAYAEEIAKARGAKLILAPVGVPGSLTNRHGTIDTAMEKFTKSEASVTLDRPEDFNGYDITGGCKIVSRIESKPAGGALKDIGDEDAVAVPLETSNAWRDASNAVSVETRVIKGLEISAKFITDDGNKMPQGMSAYHLYDSQDTLIIVTRSGINQNLIDEAIYHEAKEAAWITELIARAGPKAEEQKEEISRKAHILAAAEESLAFIQEGQLTPYHQSQLKGMPLEKLQGIINENRDRHHEIIEEYLGKEVLVQVQDYEALFKKQAAKEQGLDRNIVWSILSNEEKERAAKKIDNLKELLPSIIENVLPEYKGRIEAVYLIGGFLYKEPPTDMDLVVIVNNDIDKLSIPRDLPEEIIGKLGPINHKFFCDIKIFGKKAMTPADPEKSIYLSGVYRSGILLSGSDLLTEPHKDDLIAKAKDLSSEGLMKLKGSYLAQAILIAQQIGGILKDIPVERIKEYLRMGALYYHVRSANDERYDEIFRIKREIDALAIEENDEDSSSAPSQEASPRLPLTSDGLNAPGGIDFRTLPIVAQSIGNLSANIRNSPVNINKLSSIDLGREWEEIEGLVNSGVIPQAEKIKEYIQASCCKGSMDKDIDRVILAISDILRLEEEQYVQTEPALKDILIVLESATSIQELKTVFVGNS